MAARRSSAKTARSKKKTSADGKAGQGRKKAKSKATARNATPGRGKTGSGKGSAAKKATKKKVTKKKATKKVAARNSKTKKAGRQPASAKPGRKADRRKRSTRKTESASPPTGGTRKKAKKASTKGKAATTGRAKKAKGHVQASNLEALGRDAINQLETEGVIERLQVLAHLDDDSSHEVSLLIERLDDVASEADLPAMFGALTGDDALGIQWSIFFILERFDDHYLEALLEALPGLYARAPEWAHTAVIRILNTRDEEDDCSQAFEELALAATEDQRDSLVIVLNELATDPTGDLLPQQRESIELTLRALGEEPPDRDPLQLAGAREG